MLDKNGKRMLAYVQEITNVEPLYFCTKSENGEFIKDLTKPADSIEKINVLGWDLIAKKGEFKIGDKCIFFEIDSKVPETEPFKFLENKHYKIKTYKLNKFGIYGQGLALPLSMFDIPEDTPLNTDLTDTLKVTYAEPEDNSRKKSSSKTQRETDYMKKHKKFFSNPLIKLCMHNTYIRKLLLKPANRKTNKWGFPTHIVKPTDEERVQNMTWVLSDKRPFIATEKIDGTSTTFILERKPFHRYEFYVCSRNVRKSLDDDCYNGNNNIYWDMAVKYDVENQLKKYLKNNPQLKWVCIQGESYGEGWQKNRLQIKGQDFSAFNFIDSKNGRWNSLKAKQLLSEFNKPIPWVPILSETFILPDSIHELLNQATGPSTINPNCLREGIVFRSEDAKLSFKAVSPEYLTKHGI